jgi:hypothetical protein
MEQLPKLIHTSEAMREERQEEQAQRNHAEKNVARLESVDSQLAKLLGQYDAANMHIKELQPSLIEAESARHEALVGGEIQNPTYPQLRYAWHGRKNVAMRRSSIP